MMKSGVWDTIVDSTRMIKSAGLSFLLPARMPLARESGMINNMEQSVNSMVTGELDKRVGRTY